MNTLTAAMAKESSDNCERVSLMFPANHKTGIFPVGPARTATNRRPTVETVQTQKKKNRPKDEMADETK